MDLENSSRLDRHVEVVVLSEEGRKFSVNLGEALQKGCDKRQNDENRVFADDELVDFCIPITLKKCGWCQSRTANWMSKITRKLRDEDVQPFGFLDKEQLA